MQSLTIYYRIIKIFFSMLGNYLNWLSGYTDVWCHDLRIETVVCTSRPGRLNNCPLTEILYFYAS